MPNNKIISHSTNFYITMKLNLGLYKITCNTAITHITSNYTNNLIKLKKSLDNSKFTICKTNDDVTFI